MYLYERCKLDWVLLGMKGVVRASVRAIVIQVLPQQKWHNLVAGFGGSRVESATKRWKREEKGLRSCLGSASFNSMPPHLIPRLLSGIGSQSSLVAQAQTKEIRSMILIRGLSRHPLGSWEKSVLLRSAYLYGSWYRFARTFFWLCSRLTLLIRSRARTQRKHSLLS